MLVEEISPRVDNFGIYVDNYHCDVNDEVSCPRTLIVRHETQEVLIKTVRMMPIAVQVRWRGGRPYAAGGWAAPDPEPGLERRSEDTSHGPSGGLQGPLTSAAHPLPLTLDTGLCSKCPLPEDRGSLHTT